MLIFLHQTGHKTLECENNRVFDRSAVADMTPEAAWEMLTKACAERDMDDVRDVSISPTNIYPWSSNWLTLLRPHRRLRAT